jgi:hypothetical protein
MKRLWAAIAASTLLLSACGGGGSDDPTPVQPTPGSFTMSAAAASVQAGGSGTSTVTIARTNFTGAVNLTASAPGGVTATIANAAVTGNSADVAIAVGAAVAPGPYTITVNGAGTGVTAQTATIALTVTAAPATASFTMAAAPNPLTVAAGASGTANITLTRTNFTGPVTIAATAPTGLTATVTGSPAAGTTASVAIAAAAATAAGNYSVTLTGTGTGVTTQTVTLGVTVTAASTGSVSVAVAPTPIPVVQGASSSAATVTITRTNLTGAVSVAVEGLPAGVTATPATQEIAATATTATFTLAAAATANVGTASFTVRAFNATNNNLGSGSAQVAISAPPATGSFTMAVSPATLTFAAGGNGTLTATLTRTNFTGAVTVAASATGGLQTTVTGSPTTGNSVTVSVSAAGGTAAGTYTVTLTGTAAGATTQTATASITITGGSTGGGNTSYVFCDNLPVWFAYQDGTGAWTRVQPNGNRYSFTINSARGAIAYTDSTAGGTSPSFSTQINYGTRDELNAQGTAQTCTEVGGKTVNVAVTGFTPPASASVSLGNSFGSPTTPGSTVVLRNVQNGAIDLLASRTNFDLMNFSFAPDRYIIRRNLNPANNSTLPQLDFGSAESFAPVSANLTIANAGSDTLFVNVGYLTQNLNSVTTFSGLPGSNATTRVFGIPAAQQQANELHFYTVLSSPGLLGFSTNARGGVYFFRALADRTVTLAGPMTAPTVASAAGGTNGRFRASGTLNAPYTSYLFFNASQQSGTSVTMSATSAWLGGSAYDLTMPDFTGVAGWQTAYGLVRGQSSNWLFYGYGFTGTGFEVRPAEGAAAQYALRGGTATP